MPTVYNAANEWAVVAFLEGKIAFLTIPALIQVAMKEHQLILNPALEDILATEQPTYEFAEAFAANNTIFD
jgi:1-deoxy-D-xylulose-5-phosphate reductoisomerase